MRFTDRYILSLKVEGQRKVFYEDSPRGHGSLGVRVSPTGSKTWVFTFTIDGEVRHLVLGTYPKMSLHDANEAAAVARRHREQGLDPATVTLEQRQREREAPTVEALCEAYLEGWARPRKKSAGRDEAILKREVVPKLGRHRADAIQRRDIIAILDAIAARGSPIAANRCLAVVRKCYNWGIKRDVIKVPNPCLLIDTYGKEQPRDRVLSDAELVTFLTKLGTAPMSSASRLALRLLLLTGQRPGEIIAMRWDEVDMAAGVWTIPKEKAKNNLQHRVPLASGALAVLTQAQQVSAGMAYVFPSPRGDKPMGACALSQAMQDALPHFGLAGVRPHDLRRTCTSKLTELGVSRLTVDKMLNHKDKGVIAVYDRYGYLPEIRAALERWDRRVAELEGSQQTAVLAE